MRLAGCRSSKRLPIRSARPSVPIRAQTELQSMSARSLRTPIASSRPAAVPRAHADGFNVVLEWIGSLDAFRIAQDLKTGQQLDITRRAAGALHADASGLSGGRVFGPVLLQRVLCHGLVGKTGLFVAPENNGPAPRRFTARSDLQRRRTTSPNPPNVPLRRRARR